MLNGMLIVLNRMHFSYLCLMSKTQSFSPKDMPTAVLHSYLLGAVAPRPIGFASTIDISGKPNLAPFSFFNVFSANPPILIFSPARRVRNNTTKDTLENVLEVKEVVVNIVNYAMVQQMSLASTEYETGVNEFEKAGLTMLASDMVKPFRVAESPVQFECVVTKVEALGKDGGAGNLVFAEVVKFHIHKAVLDGESGLDLTKIDQVARMGANWYCRAKEAMFEVPKPNSKLGIGIDTIPEDIKTLELLDGNDLGKLGNIAKIPNEEELENFVQADVELAFLLQKGNTEKIVLKAREFLNNNDVHSAWIVLLLNRRIDGNSRKD